MNALKNGLMLGSMFCVVCLWPASSAQGRARVQLGYTVAGGDCLWSIAAREDVFGDPWKWPLLLDANRGRIADPHLIQVGWTLTVPPLPGAAQVAAAKRFALNYKERIAAPPQVSRALAAAPASQAPRTGPMQPAPGLPDPHHQSSSALPIASTFLLITLIAGVVYRKMGAYSTEAVAMPNRGAVETPAMVADPGESESRLESAPGERSPLEIQPGPDQGPEMMRPEDHKNAA